MRILFLFSFLASFVLAQESVYVPDDALEALIEASCPEANNGNANDNYVFRPTWVSGLSNEGDNEVGGLYYSNGTALLRIFDGNLIIEDWTGLSPLGVNSIVLQDNNLEVLDLSLWGESALENTVFGGGVKMELYDCYSLTDIVMPQDTIYVVIDNCPSLQNIQFQNSNVITALNVNQSGANSGINPIDLSNTAGFNISYGFCHLNIASNVACINLDNGSGQCLFLDALIVFNYFYPTSSVCVEVSVPFDMTEVFPGIDYNLSCPSCFTATTSEQNISIPQLLFVTDILGREVKPILGQPYFYRYSDGSVVKKMALEHN